MRALSSFFIAILLLFSFEITADAQTSISNTFTTNLSVGSSGAQVLALQKSLNQDPATRIANTGTGSPGNESSYFGLLTKAAVARFQQKYANEILVPAGLTQGNGNVGLYTRNKLNALSQLAVAPVTTPTPLTPSPSSATAPQNPNLKNLDAYVAKMKDLGLKQGVSPATLALIEDKMRAEAATTTDFTQQFFDIQKALYEKKISKESSPSSLFAFLQRALTLVVDSFSAKKAYAGLGLPFGGYITYVNPIICDCPPGIITQLFVALPNPNPAVSNLLLNYVNGSELFNYHNIPLPSIAVLGLYLPAIPSCWTYIGFACVLIPSEGQITPEVGSSLAP